MKFHLYHCCCTAVRAALYVITKFAQKLLNVALCARHPRARLRIFQPGKLENRLVCDEEVRSVHTQRFFYLENRKMVPVQRDVNLDFLTLKFFNLENVKTVSANKQRGVALSSS